MNEYFLISIIINALMGIVMYFMKMSHDNTKEQLVDQRKDINHIKETYFKKEDFREFKDELWTRFDKMENTFERRIHEVIGNK